MAKITESIELPQDRWVDLLNVLEVAAQRQHLNGNRELADEIAELNFAIRRQLNR